MNRKLSTRYAQLIVILIVLMATLVIRLFVLSVIENDNWTSVAKNITVKSIYHPAPRGKILDRYGRVLAGNVQSFSLHFSDDDMDNQTINKISLELVNILEANGDSYNDNFPIQFEGDSCYYTYQREIDTWLSEQNIPGTYTAQQAFDELRLRYGIDSSLDVFDAQQELQVAYQIYPPISVKVMKYLPDLNKERFLQKYKLATTNSAIEAFNTLRNKAEIDPQISSEDARKILSVRNELKDRGYHQYMSAVIAKDVKNSTIILIEEKSKDLKGVAVVPETKRVYPNGNTASHVIGYLGKISEANKEKYMEELGYNPGDLIGQSGIEKTYESFLKGTDGVEEVQVNNVGEKVKLISEIQPQKGKDIYLTIDLDLQKVAEESLRKALKGIQTGGTFESAYGNYHYGKKYPKAQVGAVVALDVETSKVLAMASIPDFDPNLFATGINSADWAALQSKNPRDFLSPAPLYNVAARSAMQPGSTFKMVTATAALECGLDPKKKLYDGGFIQVGNRTFGCLIWNTSRGSHGSIDLSQALEVSCNYYFYDISTGKDYYTGKSLGYKTPISIDTIMKYAGEYGLGKPTGIEIAETVAPLPSPEQKMEGLRNMLIYKLTLNAKKYFRPDVVADKELLASYISEMTGWIEENPSRTELIKRMPSVGVPEDLAETVADLCKFDYFNQAKWTLGDAFNLAIGQGENAYTPLQMANYVATIGNEGVHNQVSIIDNVEGQKKPEPVTGTKVSISDDSYLKYILDGMKKIATGSRGSLRGIFGSFPVKVAAKTGTAQKSGYISWPSEVEYVQTYLNKIDKNLSWPEVEKEMNRLLMEEPENYATRDVAVRRALINLSDGKITSKTIDQFKDTYDPFAWVVALAPAEDPKIAVAVLIFQGGTSGYAAPVAREVIGQYLKLNEDYETYSINTRPL